MQTARITLTSTDYKMLEDICDKIIEVTERTGAKHSGKIPLPTKKLKVSTRKGPCGDGKASWERYEMRIHKRLVDISADERTLRLVMRVPIPENLNIEIEMVDV